MSCMLFGNEIYLKVFAELMAMNCKHFNWNKQILFYYLLRQCYRYRQHNNRSKRKLDQTNGKVIFAEIQIFLMKDFIRSKVKSEKREKFIFRKRSEN